MYERANTAAIVLAAGLGTRFKSAKAKVLHRAAGRSLIEHVLHRLDSLGLGQVVVVVGHQRDEVGAEAKALRADADIAVQTEQLGTGHAASVGLDVLKDHIERVLVLPGDTPRVTPDLLIELLQSAADAAVATCEPDDPTGYGRVVRDGGNLARIVEEADATPEEAAIGEVNGGVYSFAVQPLREALVALGTENAQGEYYLTDVIEGFVKAKRTVAAVKVGAEEVAGVNDRVQLADVSRQMRAETIERLQRDGVTVVDPATTYVDPDVMIARDVTLLPGTILEGATAIGGGATIGPYTHLKDVEVGPGARVRNSVATDAVIGPEADVGPFAHLRPGAMLERGAKAGAFVEVKKSVIGEGSKVPHLSYIGDANIGAGVNVGAGTITCNYDGFEKHDTVIEDGAFIGSATMLVAPVTVGAGAVTGAGSAITDDVPADALAVERAEQKTIDGWAARRRARDGADAG